MGIKRSCTLISLLVSCLIISSGCNQINKKIGKLTRNDSDDAINVSSEKVNGKMNLSNKQQTEIKIVPGTKDEMIKPAYWVEKIQDKDKVIMTIDAINKFNKENMKKINTLVDLSSYKSNLTKSDLTKYIKHYKIPDTTMFDEKGSVLNKDFYDAITKNTNLSEIKVNNQVTYGIAVRRTAMRTFPTTKGVYSTRKDDQIDRFQETSLEPCEAVIVLHKSKDNKWFFVQSSTYRAWAKAEDIALSKDKNTVLNYAENDKFLIVTGNGVETDKRFKNNLIFNVGDKIPLVEGGIPDKVEGISAKDGYVVKLPSRDNKGNLNFKLSIISKNADVHKGYLPYTRANILKVAFKFLGDKYDWGNKYNGQDCSSFIMNVYKTFGFNFPRNTDEQEKGAGKIYKFKSSDSIKTREAVFNKIKPGAAVYMAGHTMLYLGKADGIPYIIHDFLGYGKKEGAVYVFAPVNEVAVTSTLLPTSNGKAYISKFTSLIQFE